MSGSDYTSSYGSGRRAVTRNVPASGQRTTVGSGRMHKDKYEKDVVDESYGPDGSKHKEKTHVEHKEVEGAVVVQKTGSSQKTHDDDCKDNGSSSWGCMWLVWIILIFIIILIIVMGCLWAIKPNCVTRECDNDDGCELDLGRAALYAFAFTFFIVLIGCAICWCCRR